VDYFYRWMVEILAEATPARSANIPTPRPFASTNFSVKSFLAPLHFAPRLRSL